MSTKKRQPIGLYPAGRHCEGKKSDGIKCKEILGRYNPGPYCTICRQSARESGDPREVTISADEANELLRPLLFRTDPPSKTKKTRKGGQVVYHLWGRTGFYPEQAPKPAKK